MQLISHMLVPVMKSWEHLYYCTVDFVCKFCRIATVQFASILCICVVIYFITMSILIFILYFCVKLKP